MITTKRVTPTLAIIAKPETKGTLSVYMLSDVHFDNPKCNRKLFKKHLEKCKKENGRVVISGDFFDLMGGKYDPRRNKKNVRDEYNVPNYLDAVIDDAIDFLEPYKDILSVISYGNHETAILNNLETDVTGRLVDGLRALGSGVVKGSYMGYIQVLFNKKKNGSYRTKKTIGYHHGKWGGIISKGTQGVPRMGLIMPDADIIHTGHSHDQWLVNQPRYRLKGNGDVVVVNQWHIKSGTYKEEFVDGTGWAVEKIVMPKALGMWKIDFNYRMIEGTMDLSEIITPLN